MLDENLPTFLLRPTNDKPKQNSTFFYSQYGSDFEPSYSLRRPDPELPSSKNRYAAALYDSFNPDVLFAEVLLIPQWTQPSLSSEAIRLNGGIPPPPEPVLPTEFTIQLYNPDQQVLVAQKPGSHWGGASSWRFRIPQQTFRQPSASTIDRTQNDPSASELTPTLGFKWRKDSKLSKDLACFLSGKTTNADGSKRKNKEPDITVAIFKALKEVTLYEPNLQRVEIEDMKGFEVVLLLSAIVIRDVYFGNLKEAFNLGSSSATSPRTAAAIIGGAVVTHTTSPSGQAASGGVRDARVPPTDPRSQWEIDVETARLKKEAEAEERERLRQEEAERRQIKQMLELEEKEKRRQQAEVDMETERLKRIYGQEEQQVRPSLSLHSVSQPPLFTVPESEPYMRPHTQSHASYPNAWGGEQPPDGPYMNGFGGPASQGGYLGPPSSGPQRVKPKTSFFGLRRESDEQKLSKKKSSLF